MSRDSDETRRLVQGQDRTTSGRGSGSLDDDEDLGEEIDDFIKGMLTDSADRQLIRSARARSEQRPKRQIPTLYRFCHLWPAQ
jgi:hypothetical protein